MNITTLATAILDDENRYSIYYLIPIVVVIMTISTFGNTFCLTIICRTSLKQDVDALIIANLAVADLCNAIITLPAIIATICLQRHLPRALCNFQGFMLIWIMACSLFTTALISIDRCIAVTNPFFYRSKITTNKAAFEIALAWLIPFCYALAPLLGLESHGFGKYDYSVLCNLNVKGANTTNNTYGYAIGIYIVLGISITITCYIIIFAVAYSKNTSFSVQDRNLKKSVITTSLIVGSNIISWVPLLVLAIGESAFPNLDYLFPPFVQRLIYLFSFINSAANPILYSFTNCILRRQLKLFFERYCCCKKAPLDLPRSITRVSRVGSVNQSPRPSIRMKKSLSTTISIHQF